MSRRAYAMALAIVILIGCARVVSTYHVFSQTVDEPAHIASGMQLLTEGRYTLDPTHPPLGRVFNAIGPFLDGIRFSDRDDLVADGDTILYAHDRYVHNLTRARLGTLPFFVAAILIVAAWTRALAGEAAAIAAAALFSNEPSVLAHAGVATTDMAATASTIAAAWALWRSVILSPAEGEGSSPRRSFASLRMTATLGAAIAFAVLSKFSALLFVPAAFAAVLLVERRRPRGIAIAAAIAAFLICAGYLFNLGPLWHGLEAIRAHAKVGHPAYALGMWSASGWWWYFPLALGVKTTIGLLLLVVAGFRREARAPLAAGLLILLVSLPVKINIGVRHVLPVYAFFAIAAGIALVRMRRQLAALLAACALIPSLAAHPDYIPYFNAFAGPRPDAVLLDSNLDWGQDLLRLATEARRRKIIDELSLAYSGTAQPDRHGLDWMRRVNPHGCTPGWLAISEMLCHKDDGSYRWLDAYEPVARVGKSIRLYYVPSPPR